MSTSVTIIVDVFRAFSTACYILEQNPEVYLLTNRSEVVARLGRELIDPIMVGKPEKGCEALVHYHIFNSPTQAKSQSLAQRDVIHRTEAGARGILAAKGADYVLAASFVNADATARFVRGLDNPKVTIMPMGHEAITPSLEDNICATYIQSLIAEEKIDLSASLEAIREGPGKYLFSDDQVQYPSSDFKRCTKIERFDFAIQADVRESYAILTKAFPK